MKGNEGYIPQLHVVFRAEEALCEPHPYLSDERGSNLARVLRAWLLESRDASYLAEGGSVGVVDVKTRADAVSRGVLCTEYRDPVGFLL